MVFNYLDRRHTMAPCERMVSRRAGGYWRTSSGTGVRSFLYFDTVDDTKNDSHYARGLLQRDAIDSSAGTVRWRQQWLSPEHENLDMLMILDGLLGMGRTGKCYTNDASQILHGLLEKGFKSSSS